MQHVALESHVPQLPWMRQGARWHGGRERAAPQDGEAEAVGAQVRQGEGHRDAGRPAGEQLPAREGRAPQVQGGREVALDRG
eukprot:13343703-Alexandrium_andersonii.AAC.1